MFIQKAVATKKVRVLGISFSIVLAGCAGFSRHAKPRLEPEGFRNIEWGTEEKEKRLKERGF